MAERRRTFGPVVLAGVAAAALAAVAGARDWVEVAASSGDPRVPMAMGSELSLTAALGSPLAGALALVVLACWGVVLVTRRRFRRVVTVLGALAAVGFAVTVAVAPWTLRADVRDEMGGAVDGTVDVDLTAWWWAAVLAAVLVVLTTVLAVRLVPGWPEMGTRYDAPAGASAAGPAGAAAGGGEGTGADARGIDMWKALDEGRDPTA